MCFTIEKDKVQPSVLSFVDRTRRKKYDNEVNKTCCCVKLTNDQVVLPIILLIFIDVVIHCTKRNSNKDMLTV